MKMTDAQKYQTMHQIVDDFDNYRISVPAYLDDSYTTAVVYSLGMTNKPTVVADDQLENMPGKDLYRTVYEDRWSMPPPSSADILDQIRNGDYTQMSGRGGSVHGRALYFARDDFWDSASYGRGEQNPMVMRAKINSDAKIVSETNLENQMKADSQFKQVYKQVGKQDAKALYALSHGIDGWYDGNYTMIVNRGALTMSSQNKSIREATRIGRSSKGRYATDWHSAAKV